MISLTYNNATFIADGVVIGDNVVFKTQTPSTTKIFKINADGYSTYTLAELLEIDGLDIKVSDVISATNIHVKGYLNGVDVLEFVTTTHPQVTLTYDIMHNLSKDEQVDILCDLAKSYSSKRVVLVWPDKADWYDENNQLVTLDGSSIAASVAGAMSAYPAQQSFTNLPFAGPYKLYHSNDYFTPSQIKKLCNAGIFVLTQSVDGGQVTCKWQRSTSTDSVEEQELSITKAVDKFSLDMIDVVKPKIGKYTITQDLLTLITEAVENQAYASKTNKAAYCGPLILNYKNLAVRANLDGQNTDLPKATIEIAITVEVGYPANFINLLIYVA